MKRRRNQRIASLVIRQIFKIFQSAKGMLLSHRLSLKTRALTLRAQACVRVHAGRQAKVAPPKSPLKNSEVVEYGRVPGMAKLFEIEALRGP